MDIAQLFGVEVSPWELIIRGTAIYWFLFIIFRLILRRDTGSVGMADVLLLVLIADAAQNAMAGEYNSISEGFILIAVIVSWNVAVDWASFRFKLVRRVLTPPPLPLIHEGRILHHNLRREFLSVDELQSKLREQGVDDVGEVKKAMMESNGQISVVKRSDKA